MAAARCERPAPAARRRAFTLLELIVVMAIIGLVAALILAAVQRVRESAARAACANRLREIALAAHGYHTALSVLPSGHSSAVSGSPTHDMSWLTRLLPYLEQTSLWAQAEADYRRSPNPFRTPPHTGLATVVPAYTCPSDDRVLRPAETQGFFVAFTSYIGNQGTDFLTPNGVLFSESRVHFSDITDGTSNTLLSGERPPSADLFFGWWYAGTGQRGTGSCDAVLGVRERNAGGTATQMCPVGPYHYRPGRFDSQCDLFHFWSPHLGGGANFAFADGSVRFVTYASDDVLPALATRSGGEVANGE